MEFFQTSAAEFHIFYCISSDKFLFVSLSIIFFS